jgi:hypothetical protein
MSANNYKMKPVVERNSFFMWSTVVELIEDDYPHKVKDYQSLVDEHGYIDLDYKEATGKSPAWCYWSIRPAHNNSKWMSVAYKSGSPMEMEWCEQLPEEYEDE